LDHGLGYSYKSVKLQSCKDSQIVLCAFKHRNYFFEDQPMG